MSCEMTSIPKRFLANVALKVFLFFMNSFYMYFKSFKFGSKFWKKCHVTLWLTPSLPIVSFGDTFPFKNIVKSPQKYVYTIKLGFNEHRGSGKFCSLYS